MSEPTLTFIANTSGNDIPYTGIGDTNYMIVQSDHKIVFTGGGILGTLPVPTCASGTRDATIKPSIQSYVVPQTYIETGTLMYNIPMAGNTPNRYVFGVNVSGTITSDLYLEAFDDTTFSTTSSELLLGSANSSNESYINAIRTTNSEPPWHPYWSGSDIGAAYLRGTEDRVPLANASLVEDTTLYFNIYIRLQTDSSTFYNEPVLAFRYLYT